MHSSIPDRSPARREDGAATRQALIEAAGMVIAEKGIDRATGREISDRAGTNAAAVNYHFGSMRGLYGEVLVEAHRRLLTIDQLRDIAAGDASPEAKLRALIAHVGRTILSPPDQHWALHVLSRELVAPSEAFAVLLERELLPKRQLATGIVGAILGLPPDHPAVARACLSVIAPLALLAISGRATIARILPGLADEHSDRAALIRHCQDFALAGLAGLGARFREE